MGPDRPYTPFEDVSTSDPKRFRVVRELITKEEAKQLSDFILSKLPEEGDMETPPSTLNLPYRPDEWDSTGVIEKIYNFGKEYLRENFELEGGLEPKTFKLIRTDGYQVYKEVFPEEEELKEKTYSLILTPLIASTGGFFAGTTVYAVNGEGFTPETTSLIVQKNMSLNNWEITEGGGGTRLDLVITFREFRQGMSYDYKIEQTPDYGEDY